MEYSSENQHSAAGASSLQDPPASSKATERMLIGPVAPLQSDLKEPEELNGTSKTGPVAPVQSDLKEPEEPKGISKTTPQESEFSIRSQRWMTHHNAWSYVTDDCQYPTFFTNLELAKDGGLSEITGTKGADDRLWYSTRYFSALFAAGFALWNSAYVVYLDIIIFRRPRSANGVEADDFLLCGPLIELVENAANALLSLFGANSEWFDNPAKLIALVELVGLFILWTRVFKACFSVVLGHLSHHTVQKDQKKWFAVQHLFSDLVPVLGVYSSLLMLFPVVPKVFVQDLFTCLYYHDTKNFKIHLCWLFLSRLICFVVGFDTFLVKYREGSRIFIASHHPGQKTDFSWSNFIGAALLLNQIVGVVQVNWMLRDRVFRFVFGGELSVLTQRELVMKDTWKALVAKRLWCAYSRTVDKFTMLLTFNDDDFQLLALAEQLKSGANMGGEHKVHEEAAREEAAHEETAHEERAQSKAIVQEV